MARAQRNNLFPLIGEKRSALHVHRVGPLAHEHGESRIDFGFFHGLPDDEFASDRANNRFHVIQCRPAAQLTRVHQRGNH